MTGDAKQCREYAQRCVEISRRAMNPSHRQMMDGLAQTWIKLALELERSEALLDAYPNGHVTPKPH